MDYKQKRDPHIYIVFFSFIQGYGIENRSFLVPTKMTFFQTFLCETQVRVIYLMLANHGTMVRSLQRNGAFKDYLPHLFHGFRSKYFNKLSLDNMLYFHN